MASANGGYCQTDRCHVVQYGETLFSIGRMYDVHPYHIAEVNNLYNPNYIYAGQVLYIPYGSSYPWNAGCGYNDCGGYYPGGNCGNDCGGYGYEESGYHHGGNCGYNDCYEKPAHYPGYGCDSGCNSGYYGYDYTGYYYGSNYPNHKQYSHTCGYNSNCW
ncbi:MAG: LysM peptidoglycan-binding domain-containing protein [Anaerolineae bacterium]|nr:LysM peptidoglycan-binding domain-containing protein [Anaerolineae bacterium]